MSFTRRPGSRHPRQPHRMKCTCTANCFIGRHPGTGEDSKRIFDTFRIITENNMTSFLWCPRLIFSAPEYLVFPAGCSQRDDPAWNPGAKDSLYKRHVDCLPGNILPNTAKRTQTS
ncbi:hypothetical protein TNCV_1825551 [Trichonephila clavipes]|nr:hypothetical protein TNCV_1825551 [Trichonephila clavipes]